MVDITRCVRCGKVIPATDKGCAWCDAADREAGIPAVSQARLGMPIRMLLLGFSATLAFTAFLALLTLIGDTGGSRTGSLLSLLAGLRLVLSLAALAGIWRRQPWARVAAFLFMGFEAATAIAGWAGWLPAGQWIGGMVAPLWALLFVFLFLREDTKRYLNPSLADRDEVGALIESIRGGKPGD